LGRGKTPQNKKTRRWEGQGRRGGGGETVKNNRGHQTAKAQYWDEKKNERGEGLWGLWWSLAVHLVKRKNWGTNVSLIPNYPRKEKKTVEKKKGHEEEGESEVGRAMGHEADPDR